MFKAYMLGQLSTDKLKIESVFICAEGAEEHTRMASKYVEIFSREGATYSAAWVKVRDDFMSDPKWDWCRAISPWPNSIPDHASER